MPYTMHYASPIGRLTLAGDETSFVGLWMEDQKYFGGALADRLGEQKKTTALGLAAAWLDAYFAGEKPSSVNLPLAPEGSAFRKAVWDVLCEIPYGQYVTYGDVAATVAARMGTARMSCQAVGGAVGHNPISIIIPCHRVVGKNGSLTGYAGGIEKKSWLLDMEGADTSGLFVPAKSTAM